MNVTKHDYFFYEWLILDKGMSKEEFQKLTEEQFTELRIEYARFYMKLVKFRR